MRVVIVDDESESSMLTRGLFDGTDHHVACVSSIEDAIVKNADVYIIDVTTLMPFTVGGIAGVVSSEIEAIFDRHPGADIVLSSFHPKNYLDQLKSEVETIIGRKVYTLQRNGMRIDTLPMFCHEDVHA